MKEKIRTLPQLLPVLEKLRRSGQKVVFTNGCFDLLHAGHVRYLRRARAAGDLLVVGLNSDRSVKGLKGEGRPLVPEAERAELLAALEMVDYVVIFDQPTPRDLIVSLGPEVLVKGGDWKREEIAGAEEVEAAGGRVLIVPLVPGRSTSALLEKITEQGRSRVEI
ncbi:MAG: D-glycero-beta-D-manno-heptose 1-phosphate adenylyltransferase [Candidatus Erginobacter occultus]|nr:D-glycero-beta-D-manno-heptose 1-phosphate adenylyltransferase [Candidatus Erginobacter occultus]